jgi:hypothetical protein
MKNRHLLAVALCTLAACQPLETTELTRAVVAKDNGAVARLLSAGAAPDEGKLRPIVWAARLGNSDAIRLLAKAGADVNREDGGNDWTPIQHAAHKRQAGSIATLIELGADPNRRSGNAPSALMMAAGYGDLASVNVLLANGADPSLEISPGINALWAALGGGAIADITDGPPLGSCFPKVVARIRETAPRLRLARNGETKAMRVIAKEGCAALIDASLE